MADQYIQGPDDRRDYQNDWSEFLAVGDSIVSRVWSIDPDVGSPSLIVAGGTSATVWVANLTLGMVYRLFEQITTANGVTDGDYITIRCEDK